MPFNTFLCVNSFIFFIVLDHYLTLDKHGPSSQTQINRIKTKRNEEEEEEELLISVFTFPEELMSNILNIRNYRSMLQEKRWPKTVSCYRLTHEMTPLVVPNNSW